MCYANSDSYAMETFIGNFAPHFWFYRPGRADFTFPSLSFEDLLVDFLMTSQKGLQSVVSESYFFFFIFVALAALAANCEQTGRVHGGHGGNHTNTTLIK